MEWEEIEKIIFDYIKTEGSNYDAFFDINNCDLDGVNNLLDELYEEIENIIH